MKKRILAAVLAATTMLGMVGCSQTKKEEEQSTGMANPITQCESLDALNKSMNTKLCAPGVMGVEDVAYQLIDNGGYQIGEYIFKVAGQEYDFRVASTKDDISGVYINGEAAFNKDIAEDEDIQYVESDEIKAARWFMIEGQYEISVKDDGKLSMESFKSMVNELYQQTTSDIDRATAN
ncbi:MAG: hypothetical protein HUJ53_00185 [Holdemanella sp.]|nr:hypothetical protein [Holdemanella sp.]